MLLFDIKGHLTPYTLIPTDWLTFVDTFGWNQHRLNLVKTLTSLIEQLNEVPIQSFTLWLDGSFVTRKEYPGDLDAVLFLSTTDYHLHEHRLRILRDQLSGLDLYFVREIGITESDYFLYQSDQTEWFFQFSMTRPDRRSYRKHPKGFIQITWPNEQVIESAQ